MSFTSLFLQIIGIKQGTYILAQVNQLRESPSFPFIHEKIFLKYYLSLPDVAESARSLIVKNSNL